MKIACRDSAGDHPLMPQWAAKQKAAAEAAKKAAEEATAAEDGASSAASSSSSSSAAQRDEVVDDPLAPGRTRVALDEDPLAMMMGGGAPAAPAFVDPLSSPGPAAPPPAPSVSGGGGGGAGAAVSSGKLPLPPARDEESSGGLPGSWAQAKKIILREYTVSGKISANFLGDAEFDESGGA